MSPADFTAVKQKIESSPMLSESEKKEWLFFLPHMTAEHIKELDRILSLKLSPSSNQRAAISEQQKPTVPSQLPPGNAELGKFRFLSVSDLRQAPSVYVFLEELGKKMRELIRQKQASLEQITQAFEQSPLYHAYVDAGFQIMQEGQAQPLSQSEFEAIADFRARFRKILS